MSYKLTSHPKILLVEDEESIHTLLVPYFQLDGFELIWNKDGDSAITQAIDSDIQLLLLDVQLPGIGGVEICRRVRAAKPQLPIIMLTSMDSEIDKVVALDAGADDYVTKPFGIHELMARIRARLRSANKQSAPNEEEDVLRFGELLIDPIKRQVKKAEQNLELTALEFDFVLFLASQPGRPFGREDILRQVWGVEAEGYEDNVAQVVRRIRRKIEDDPENPKLLLTARGVGYAFCEKF